MRTVAFGDFRNVMRTVNSLPRDFTGKLTVLINDHNSIVTLRNILTLLILGSVSDKRVAADIALHFWYSAFLSARYYTRIAMLAAEVVASQANLSVELGPRAHLDASTNEEIKLLCARLVASERTYGVEHATDELRRVWYGS